MEERIMNNMYEQPLVSVIIPVYNVEQYVRECIESVIQQTYTNIEIVIVDDGSLDKSMLICQKYQKEDLRIKVYHKENGGLSDARNYGVQHSKGEYICFIDSDDYVSKYYIQNMVDMMHIYNVPLVVTGVFKFDDNNEERHISKIRSDSEDVIYNTQEALEDGFYRKNIPMYACAKLYQRYILEKVQFPKGELYEDISTTYLFFHEAGKVVFNPQKDYYYRQRQGSIVNSQFDERKMIQIDACEKIIKFTEDNYPQIIKAAKSKAFINAYNIYCTIPNNKKYNHYVKKLKSIICQNRYLVFRDNKNKLVCRMVAGCCLISPLLAKLIGQFQQFCVTKKIIKQNKPL